MVDPQALQALIALATILGSGFSSFIATKIAIAVLQTKVDRLEEDVADLRKIKAEHNSKIMQHHFRLFNLDHRED